MESIIKDRKISAILIQPPSPRVGFTLPLGLAYIGAILKQKGIEVKIVDAAAPYAGYNTHSIMKLVKDYSPTFVGITVTTLFTGFAYDLIQGLKKTNTTIVAGGPHPTLFPEETIEYGANIVVRNEGEETVKELVDYFQGKRMLEDILGVSYKDNAGDIINNAPRPLIDDLDSLPLPAKELFSMKDYVSNQSDLWRYGGIITSRGCFGRCLYCSKEIFGRKYRIRSADNIMYEIKFLHRTYGLNRFSFLDDVFTANQHRIYELCERIKKENFNITWNCVSRVDCITTDLLKVMHEAGCNIINYGVESANPATLKLLKKGVTIDKIENAINETKKVGIDCTINFMWGYPWESEPDLENTVGFIKKISPKVAEIMSGGMLIPFPGTELYEHYKNEYGFDHWWLKRNKYTGTYRTKTWQPLFRYFLFDDQGQFDSGGFFELPQQILNKIKKISRFIDRKNLADKHPPVVSFIILNICNLSKLIYRINPAMEILFGKIVFRLIRFKNQLTRKKLN